MMSLTLQKILLMRFWKFFFQSYFAIALIWVFSLGIKLFIRQEIYSPKVIAYLTLATLPSVLPYMACLAGMFMIIHLDKTRELHLIKLMGLSRRKRLLHLSLVFLALPLLSFLFEGFIKPVTKQVIKSPDTFLSNDQFSNLVPGIESKIENWIFIKSPQEKIFMVKNEPSKLTSILSKNIHFNASPEAHLQLDHGSIWPDLNFPKQFLKFDHLKLPIVGQTHLSLREHTFSELQNSDKTEFKQKMLILRNALSPAVLLYLGLALGYFSIVLRKGAGFIVCLFILLAVYFPLQILGRKSIDLELLPFTFILILPFLAVGGIAHLLNRWAERKGAPI